MTFKILASTLAALSLVGVGAGALAETYPSKACLLYTSPSPRD